MSDTVREAVEQETGDGGRGQRMDIVNIETGELVTTDTALAQREAVIERHLGTFVEVGQALLEIRDLRLYKVGGWGSFEEYCRERWAWTRNYANKLIGASEVAGNLMGTIVPTNEAQARSLTALDPDEQRLVWQIVTETAPDGKVSASHVKSVVNVFKEVLTTGAIDDGEGDSLAVHDLVKAAITEETYERMMRQQEHIKANGKQKPKLNRAGNEYEPQGFDACQTPPYALDPLLRYLNPHWLIWEPARGEGLLAETLYDAGYSEDCIATSDILTGQNFFEYEPPVWDALITNPPYSIKYKWLERCYALGKPFALLLPVETLGAQSAQVLFKQYGIQVLFMDRRVNFKMPNIGFEGSAAQFPVAWFCWKMDLEKDLVFASVSVH